MPDISKKTVTALETPVISTAKTDRKEAQIELPKKNLTFNHPLLKEMPVPVGQKLNSLIADSGNGKHTTRNKVSSNNDTHTKKNNRNNPNKKNSKPQKINDSKLEAKNLNLYNMMSMPKDKIEALLNEEEVSFSARQSRGQVVVNYFRKLSKRFKLTIAVSGTLEIPVYGNPAGTGYLRQDYNSYTTSPEDIIVSSSLLKKYNFSTGDFIEGEAKAPGVNPNDFMNLITVSKLNKLNPDTDELPEPFENKRAHFPDQKLELERGNGLEVDIAGRIIDLVSPIGRGQRGLIVSPPKAGKTVLLQRIATAIEEKHPECKLIILLIDERPEEVTDMLSSVKTSEVIASTFDEPASRHVQVAEIVIGRAKRMVEQGFDVIILLDSITRLARAYNTMQPASGKILTGGVDARALERPKRFFGTARNVSEGGSLTILASALVETGSKMDEVIYEEFKGTGNMEVHLERKIAEKRVFPAINIRRSGTRREDLLMDDGELQKVWILRKLLHSMEDLPAMEFMLEKLKDTKTNDNFFASMRKL